MGRPKSELSPTERKLRLQHSRVAQGLCRDCSEPIFPGSKSRCLYHIEKNREYNREHRGYQGYKTGTKPLG